MKDNADPSTSVVREGPDQRPFKAYEERNVGVRADVVGNGDVAELKLRKHEPVEADAPRVLKLTKVQGGYMHHKLALYQIALAMRNLYAFRRLT